MAVLKYGPLASEVRGSIGGTVFSRSRAGTYARARRKPVDAPTNVRNAYQSTLATVYGRWADSLTNAQRIVWNTLGANTTFLNALGEEYHPTGYNLYVRTNALTIYWGFTPIDTAPATAVATHYAVNYRWLDDPGVIQVQVHADCPDNMRCLFHTTAPQRHTIYYCRGPYIQRSWLTGDEAKNWQAITPVEFYNEDDRVFIKDRNLDNIGRVSAPYHQYMDLEI